MLVLGGNFVFHQGDQGEFAFSSASLRISLPVRAMSFWFIQGNYKLHRRGNLYFPTLESFVF